MRHLLAVRVQVHVPSKPLLLYTQDRKSDNVIGCLDV